MNPAAASELSRSLGRRSAQPTMMTLIMRVERMAEGCQPVAAVYDQINGMTSHPQTARGICSTRSSATRIPAMSAMCSPLMAKMCIVPVRMNGSETSCVSAVVQPSAMAQSRRNDSSCSGRPRSSVTCAQLRNRSASGGLPGVPFDSMSRQSFVLWTCS